MVEGGAAEAPESEIIDALMFAHQTAQPILELIERMRAAVGKPKRSFEKKALSPEVAERVKVLCDKEILAASLIKEKKARYDAYKATKTKLTETLAQELGADKLVPLEKL